MHVCLLGTKLIDKLRIPKGPFLLCTRDAPGTAPDMRVVGRMVKGCSISRFGLLQRPIGQLPQPGEIRQVSNGLSRE